MISDVMSDTVISLDSYLNNSLYDDTYTGKLRERIVRVRNEARDIRTILDARGLPADFISPFDQTDRPAIDRWKALSEGFLFTSVEAYVKARLDSYAEWTDEEREQLVADLAELQAIVA